mmetsp:Transcript_6291/g.9122  ORF Transcript_6291/g.9122 Transcript_6291/m.9122 type:complete len:397 (-) Transcript_6291:43-1233(-)
MEEAARAQHRPQLEVVQDVHRERHLDVELECRQHRHFKLVDLLQGELLRHDAGKVSIDHAEVIPHLGSEHTARQDDRAPVAVPDDQLRLHHHQKALEVHEGNDQHLSLELCLQEDVVDESVHLAEAGTAEVLVVGVDEDVIGLGHSARSVLDGAVESGRDTLDERFLVQDVVGGLVQENRVGRIAALPAGGRDRAKLGRHAAEDGCLAAQHLDVVVIHVHDELQVLLVVHENGVAALAEAHGRGVRGGVESQSRLVEQARAAVRFTVQHRGGTGSAHFSQAVLALDRSGHGPHLILNAGAVDGTRWKVGEGVAEPPRPRHGWPFATDRDGVGVERANAESTPQVTVVWRRILVSHDDGVSTPRRKVSGKGAPLWLTRRRVACCCCHWRFGCLLGRN